MTTRAFLIHVESLAWPVAVYGYPGAALTVLLFPHAYPALLLPLLATLLGVVSTKLIEAIDTP